MPGKKTTKHTPKPWRKDMQFVVADDPTGEHPDIYIAEIVVADEESRYVLSEDEQDANGRLIAAAPELLDALIRLCEYGNLLLTRTGASGHRQTASGEWVADPASQAFLDARKVIIKATEGDE
jgi:hypothetical protein